MDPNEAHEILQEQINNIEEDQQNDDISINSNPTGENQDDSNEKPTVNNEDDTDNNNVDNEVEENENEPIAQDQEPEYEAAEQTTRSGCMIKAPNFFYLHQHHLFTQGHKVAEYTMETGNFIAKTMHYLNNLVSSKKYAFLETYSLKKGLKNFVQKGYDAALGEIKQLHDRVVFKPMHVNELLQQEKKRAMESLIFLVEKRDGRVNARACANINKEEGASPAAATESILLTATIDAKEHRDIMSADISNAFVQTDMVNDGNEKVIMKIRGPLVHMLVSLDPVLYNPFVVSDNADKVLYVQLLRSLYGTLQAALLFYKKLKRDLESIRFKINP
jgi:hypothetical protein